MTIENLIYSLSIIWITSVFALALAQGVSVGIGIDAKARARRAQVSADKQVSGGAQTRDNADANPGGNAEAAAGVDRGGIAKDLA